MCHKIICKLIVFIISCKINFNSYHPVVGVNLLPDWKIGHHWVCLFVGGDIANGIGLQANKS